MRLVTLDPILLHPLAATSEGSTHLVAATKRDGGVNNMSKERYVYLKQHKTWAQLWVPVAILNKFPTARPI